MVIPTTAPATLFADHADQAAARETVVEWMQRIAREVQHAIRPEHY
jgi:hypothetical protein